MSELYHHGILGQKWGVRRYQNKDGSLTVEGKERYMYANRARRAFKTKADMDRLYNTLSKKKISVYLAMITIQKNGSKLKKANT